MLPQATEARPRRRIGRYVITGRIGRGGMGMVYRGLDEALEREVAVKTLTVEGSSDDDSRRRFLKEAKAAGGLQHPNIVIVYELGGERGVPFIAMEMLPGVDLEALLRSGETLTLAEKLDVVIQVCRGLAYAHDRGIVHRDIKPSNVRLLDDGTAKIMDFGIAKLVGARTQLTKTGMMVGTVHYMSPEQVRGRPLDGRTDVFSVGVILYELLAGQRPFHGEGPTQVLYKIVHEAPPTPDLSAFGAVGPRLAAILDRALAKDPEERYPGAAALADDLTAVLEEHRHGSGTPPAPDAVEGVTAARRAVREGRVEEGIARLRELVAAHPGLVEARRALRAALREQKERLETRAPEADDFPELEATFAVPPTRREPGTLVQATQTIEAAAPDAGAVATGLQVKGRAWLWVALPVLVVVGAATYMLRAARTPRQPAELRLSVHSQPMGATVLVNGRETGVRTNGEIVLPSPVPSPVVLTFRKAGHREETRTLRLPLAPGEAVSVTLQADASVLPVRTEPPGASVTIDGERVAGVTPLEVPADPARDHRLEVVLDGYVPQEARVPAGRTAPIDIRLERVLPSGTVAVSSTYPLDVLWRGKTLAKGEISPRVQVSGGRQVLTLVSGSLFLRAEVPVSVVSGGETPIAAPAVGRVSIRANPDNCEVFIDGTFVDYPPIMDRPLAAGTHTVGFRWPDGHKSEQAVQVSREAATYVTGRKESP